MIKNLLRKATCGDLGEEFNSFQEEGVEEVIL
jgi:hypothetical protein